MRTPLQGVWNIVRFNWHFFVIAGVVALAAGGVALALDPPWRWLLLAAVAAALLGMFVSLAVSYFVYDRSALYRLPWLDDVAVSADKIVIAINAGFDEVTPDLRRRYPEADVRIWDFYDAEKHSEVSIKRAREAYPPDPGTKVVETHSLPLEDGAASMVCLMMAAHEIRSAAERRAFFGEIRRILAADGSVWVCEHLRDAPNFLAYSFGAFHFYAKSEWRSVCQ